MLRAVMEVGQYIREEQNLDTIDVLVQESKLPESGKVVYLLFEKNKNKLRFKRVDIKEYSGSKAAKQYLYRTFRHGRWDVTPTAKPGTGGKVGKLGDPEKRYYYTRWPLWFDNQLPKVKEEIGDKRWKELEGKLVDSLKEELIAKDKKTLKKNIFKEIKRKFETLSGEEKEDAIFSIRIKENGKEKDLINFKIFREIFLEGALKKFSDKYDVEGCISENKETCRFCGEKKKVLGFASPFSYYTLDPKGFAYGFNPENSWKQLPICSNCAASLQKGKEFVRTYLSFSYYGHRYFVIPHFLNASNQEKKRITDIIRRHKDEEYREGLLNEEDPFGGGVFGELRDKINLSFIFHKPKQKDYFDIYRAVREVPPSWRKQMEDVFTKVNRKLVFHEKNIKEILGKDWTENFQGGYWKGEQIGKQNLGGMLRTFFPRETAIGTYDKYFLDITADILSQESINKDLLIRAFVKRIRQAHKNNPWREKLFSLKSLYLLEFLNKLKLMNNRENGMNEEDVKALKKAEDLFEENAHTFDKIEKRAAFLEGVVTNRLLAIQSMRRGSTPFRKKLRGLRLDVETLRRIWTDLDNKFAAYDRELAYKDLRKKTAEYLIKAEENGWDLSKNEISYYFALGLNLGWVFKSENENKSKGGK